MKAPKIAPCSSCRVSADDLFFVDMSGKFEEQVVVTVSLCDQTRQITRDTPSHVTALVHFGLLMEQR